MKSAIFTVVLSCLSAAPAFAQNVSLACDTADSGCGGTIDSGAARFACGGRVNYLSCIFSSTTILCRQKQGGGRALLQIDRRSLEGEFEDGNGQTLAVTCGNWR